MTLTETDYRYCKLCKGFHECRRCHAVIPHDEYYNPVGTGYCYGCYVNYTSECPKLDIKQENDKMAEYPEVVNGLRLCANCGMFWTDSPNGICAHCLDRRRLPDGLEKMEIKP